MQSESVKNYVTVPHPVKLDGHILAKAGEPCLKHMQLLPEVTVMKKLLHLLFFSWISFSEAIFFDKNFLTELLGCNDIAALSDTQDLCPSQVW